MQHVLLDEKPVKEEISLFNNLNRFLFLPHLVQLFFKGRYDRMAYILTHDLFTKHTVVVLNQHSETFTLLQSIDNDISHIYCILIPEGHVVYTDKSPESHSFTKGERRSK